ncbi:MAG: ATP-grasp domain-containing protein [Candidatus Bathyarchaeia archaeon]
MVRLYEYQGKKLLKTINIPVPEGYVASTPDEVEEIAKKLNRPVVIKAQILTTGRFKAGGIRFATSPEEAKLVANEILGKEIKGLKVEKLLVEEKLNIDREYFLSITVSDSYKVKSPVILFSTLGGVDVEVAAEEHPEKVVITNVDYLQGLQYHETQTLVSKLVAEPHLVDAISSIACKLYDLFRRIDASTVEINPLILTKENKIVAGDCRITIDDNSVYRHPELNIDFPRDMLRPPTELERIAWKIEESDYRGTCYFVQLVPSIEEIKRGGYIAFHGIGGGASMLAADILMRKGLKLATYVDTSGNPTASKVYRAIKTMLSLPVDGYCLIGAVMANQEQWYHGFAIVKALREEVMYRPGFPTLILIAGNKERETHRIISEGLKGLPLRWELYGRDHIYDIEFLADRMMALVEEYRGSKEYEEYRRRIGGMPSETPAVIAEKKEPRGNVLQFEFETGKVIIDLSKCIAPACGFACVKADRWYGRSCLRIEDGKLSLTGTSEQLKRLCNECLACEVVCELYGGKAIKIDLPLYGLIEFRKKYGMPM